jgi:hypothetical protein
MDGIELKSLDKPDETRKFEGLGWADIVSVGGKAVAKGHFQPGWKWSVNVKPIAGTELCEFSHLIYCLEGKMQITMKDGSKVTLAKGDAAAVPPGHDAEVVGQEDCIAVDFGEIDDYALRR